MEKLRHLSAVLKLSLCSNPAPRSLQLASSYTVAIAVLQAETFPALPKQHSASLSHPPPAALSNTVGMDIDFPHMVENTTRGPLAYEDDVFQLN